MTQRLIILRGNSGSGKSTIARLLQHKLGYGTMLVPQDMIRREILRVGDEVDNPAIQLIYETAKYGKNVGYNVIVEGILTKKKYGSMLNDLITVFNNKAYIYYFDVSFEETLRRHQTKSKVEEFGEKEMREWWQDNDYLGMENEKKISQDMSEADIVDMILHDLS